jgi:hypothetical protein
MCSSTGTTDARHTIVACRTTIMTLGALRNSSVKVSVLAYTVSASIRNTETLTITRGAYSTLVAGLAAVDTGRTKLINSIVVVT